MTAEGNGFITAASRLDADAAVLEDVRGARDEQFAPMRPWKPLRDLVDLATGHPRS